MKVVRHLSDLETLSPPVVLVTGFFDGVHRGHQALLSTAREHAAELNAESWVLTFDPHPSKILRPEHAKPLMTSTAQKLDLLGSLGMTGTIMLPFTLELANLEAEVFVEELQAALPGLKEVVVGSNWTFGKGARGNPGLLRSLAAGKKFEVTVVAPVLHEGAPVSSTRIRDAVFAGRLEDAEAMLGRPYSVVGKVIRGRRYGTTIGFPTANVLPESEVYPPFGIYAVRLRVDDRIMDGAAYIGHHSAVPAGSLAQVVEVHVLDAYVDLYDRDVEVFFIKFIRDDRRFFSEQELKDRIASDVAGIREYLKS
ncbi:MAG: riboflavin biosynthesis protein RibF [Verrucomicrobia bacterium]|nr:riboflavin biosynthesis protein RibF [Verrucomicrobiota bacterium]